MSEVIKMILACTYYILRIVLGTIGTNQGISHLVKRQVLKTGTSSVRVHESGYLKASMSVKDKIRGRHQKH